MVQQRPRLVPPLAAERSDRQRISQMPRVNRLAGIAPIICVCDYLTFEHQYFAERFSVILRAIEALSTFSPRCNAGFFAAENEISKFEACVSSGS